ncbi:MAG: hypothetical protein JXA06_01015 [Bacteroidetes bacterium]|nr:hypothetical protein [Bacteroidota bacterium]
MKKKNLFFILAIIVLVAAGIYGLAATAHSNAVKKSHDDLMKDLSFYATKAREYYERPAALGGGNRNFADITLSKLSVESSNATGRFFIVGTPTKDEVVIAGVGFVITQDDSTRVQVLVTDQNTTFQVIN